MIHFTRQQLTWLEITFVVILIGVGAFLRLYRIRDTLMFQADQGRDALVVKEMIKAGDLTLLGPVMSVGNLYLGPFYYYFMAPFLALTYPDPIGPVYAVSLINIILLWILYLGAKDMFGRRGALFTLFIYTFMPAASLYSRFSWNPNLAPFVSFLIMWCLYKAWHDRKYAWLYAAVLLMGILTQLHYLALVMVGVIGICYILMLLTDKPGRKGLLLTGLLSLGIYLLTWTPLIVFNQRHNNMILNSFAEFAFGDGGQFSSVGRTLKIIRETEGKSYHVLAKLVASVNGTTDRLITFSGTVFFLVLLLTKKVKVSKEKGLTIVLITLLCTIVGAAVYSGSLFDHYLGFAYPAVALFWGYLLAILSRLKRWAGIVITSLILLMYMGAALQQAPAFGNPGPSIALFRRTANDIITHLDGTKYNLALLSESRDFKGMNYRYFLAVTDKPPAKYDDYDNLEKLVVIDELRVPEPLVVKIFEIQRPNLFTLENVFDIPNGPRVYIYRK